MTLPTLVLGEKNWSSWSMRPWLVLTMAGIEFTEARIHLRQGERTKAEIAEYSPSGLVPVLKLSDGTVIWDTLAISEWAHEQAPNAGLWPTDPIARAVARSVTAEMHSGFVALRREMPMDIINRYPGQGMTDEVQANIDRIQAVWADCRARFGQGGDFLFGTFTIADAFYAPVVTRFETYGVPLEPVSLAYVEAVKALPAMKVWTAEGARELEGLK